MIRRYDPAKDAEQLMALLKEEGEEWACYWADSANENYRYALANSITYVACQDGQIVGYSRSLGDFSFYIYVCDLLVRKSSRGQGLGLRLMQCLYEDYPKHVVYVMSDVDEYYLKQGCLREGSVFEVPRAGGIS